MTPDRAACVNATDDTASMGDLGFVLQTVRLGSDTQVVVRWPSGAVRSATEIEISLWRALYPQHRASLEVGYPSVGERERVMGPHPIRAQLLAMCGERRPDFHQLDPYSQGALIADARSWWVAAYGQLDAPIDRVPPAQPSPARCDRTLSLFSSESDVTGVTS